MICIKCYGSGLKRFKHKNCVYCDGTGTDQEFFVYESKEWLRYHNISKRYWKRVKTGCYINYFQLPKGDSLLDQNGAGKSPRKDI